MLIFPRPNPCVGNILFLFYPGRKHFWELWIVWWVADFCLLAHIRTWLWLNKLLHVRGSTKRSSHSNGLQFNWEETRRNPFSAGNTLRSITMSGHVKYKRNSLACKMQEDSACNTHLPLKIKHGLIMYLYWPFHVTLTERIWNLDFYSKL